MIETIRPVPEAAAFQGAVFDFDGTVSLLTEGWQDDMLNQFFDTLRRYVPVPESEIAATRQTIADFIFGLTGKSPIYQCIRLSEEILARGGQEVNPDDILAEYTVRMANRLRGRHEQLRSDQARPEQYMVPGIRPFLDILRAAGLHILLVSGSEIKLVRPQCELLQITDYFDGGIFGPPEDSRNFAKEAVIRDFIDRFQLEDSRIVGFGDGYVETKFVHDIGSYAVGLATNETTRDGKVNGWKRQRLLEAGADAIVPDFSQPEELACALGIIPASNRASDSPASH